MNLFTSIKNKIVTNKLKDLTVESDSKKIISALVELRKPSKINKIDSTTFELLVNLIKNPNTKILDYSLSILANCCMNTSYRYMFKDLDGIPHLMLVVKTIDNDSIICRACRLIGNLSMSREVAKHLESHEACPVLLKLIENYETMSSDTRSMAFRALTKLLCSLEKIKLSPSINLSSFQKCLYSEDEELIRLTLEAIQTLSPIKLVQRYDCLKVNKDIFYKIIKLYQINNLKSLAISCLSTILYYQQTSLFPFLEGSGVAEVYIDYVQNNNIIDRAILRTFHMLCHEVFVRDKIKVLGLHSRLVDLCNATNVKYFLLIYQHFQYDECSLSAFCKHPNFIPILTTYITFSGAVPVLAALSRLQPPLYEFIKNENLDLFINSPECLEILKNIVGKPEFLKPLLMSGRIWEIEKAGCFMDELANNDLIEGSVIQFLHSAEEEKKENIALAVPFLIKNRHFETLYKFLARHHVIRTIMRLFRENPLEERILASVLQVIKIFRSHYCQSFYFFQDLIQYDTDFDMEIEECNLGFTKVEEPSTTVDSKNRLENVAWITFVLDDGSSVVVDKELFCKHSPVLDSMLNGHFIESFQDKVRFPKCSGEALVNLEKLLSGEISAADIKIEVHLELLNLTERLLLTELNDTLTENLKINKNSCWLVYLWHRKAGHTKNYSLIRRNAYEFIFSSSENLMAAMKNDECRVLLIDEIINYLKNALLDLL